MSEDLGPRLLQALCESLDWDLGELWRVDGDVLRYDSGWHRPELDTREFDAVSRETVLSRGMGLAGRVWETGQACWVTSGDRLVGGRAAAAARIGLKSGCAFPIRGERHADRRHGAPEPGPARARRHPARDAHRYRQPDRSASRSPSRRDGAPAAARGAVPEREAVGPRAPRGRRRPRDEQSPGHHLVTDRADARRGRRPGASPPSFSKT